jgi:hypothetical protein
MTRFRGMVCAVAAMGAIIPTALAHADVTPPELGAGCAPELTETMTLLPDQITYAACQRNGVGFAWAPVQTPFPPKDRWLSYGPSITLHGQGMRNPNLSSGRWTATPQDPESTCTATETTVVEAGVLAQPRVFEGEQGQPLRLEMLPQLFYAELAGNCLWVKD